MLEWVIFVLVVALLLYVLLGGADFGAGILELFSPKEKFDELKSTTYHAIGPVWEANHVWLIIVIVILFNGFPSAFKVISTYLHLPLLFMLVGIIIRGTTFVFRHYDAVQGRSQKYYSRFFAWSSLVTPLFLGITAGAVLLGRFPSPGTPPESIDFYTGYVAPWFNWFTMSVGVFTISLFAFLAASFMIPEVAQQDTRELFRRNAIISNVLVVLIGGLVFLAGLAEDVDFTLLFFSHPLSIVCVTLATVSLLVLAITIRKKWDQLSRLLAAGQVTLIVLGWLALQYPYIVRYGSGDGVSLAGAAAPQSVMLILGTALAVGVVLILPALGYLIWVFKYRKGLR